MPATDLQELVEKRGAGEGQVVSREQAKRVHPAPTTAAASRLSLSSAPLTSLSLYFSSYIHASTCVSVCNPRETIRHFPSVLCCCSLLLLGNGQLYLLRLQPKVPIRILHIYTLSYRIYRIEEKFQQLYLHVCVSPFFSIASLAIYTFHLFIMPHARAIYD